VPRDLDDVGYVIPRTQKSPESKKKSKFSPKREIVDQKSYVENLAASFDSSKNPLRIKE
jgi:hypothetical protein